MTKRFIIAFVLLASLIGAGNRVVNRSGGGGGGGGTIGPIAIAANGDDGQIFTNGGAGIFYSNGEGADGIGYAGRSDDQSQVTFLRFVLPSAIPSGATISNATLVLRGRDQFGWVNGTDDLTVRATDSANASAPTTAGQRMALDGGSTSTTTAVAAWNDITWSTSSTNTFTGLASVIQELVTDNGGLASGAGVVIWLRGTAASDKYVGLELLEHAGTEPATLSITWTP